MYYADIERGLTTSIDENDPNKTIKQLQIKRWSHLHGKSLLESWGELKMPFFQKVLRDEECWKKVDTLEQVKLDRYTVGRKLIALRTEDGEKHILKSFDRYKIACRCCFEKDIHAIFEEFKSEIGDEPVENLVKRLDYSALMIYWSHVMNKQEHRLKINYPNVNCHKYVHGFSGAILEKCVEALEFFWNKLQSVDDISVEQKEDLLIQAALYKGINRSATADMVNFCLRYLDSDKYQKLLERDFKQNGYYSTLYKLEDEYFFDSVKELFSHIEPKDIPNKKYMLLVHGALEQISLAPNNNFIKAGYDMLSVMWNAQGFEEHKQYYLHELCNYLGYAKDICNLIKGGEIPEILSQIIGSLTLEQVKYMQEVNEVGYIILSARELLNEGVINSLSKSETSSSENLEQSVILSEDESSISVLGAVAIPSLLLPEEKAENT